MRHLSRTILCCTSALGLGLAGPAFAQDAEESNGGNDIIVTAQRVEQRLQDVPISITVLDQQTLTNNNVTNAKDLAAYTPGLSVNNRYGSDSTTFSIRGFTQDQRTFATVGTFFADVVALRGSGATFGGDGAGPGALFDLQNVQVLKGPQGTLFGRNVTGGAVLLVPRRPVDKFEGYVEASGGDYDMRRVQAVVNLPVMDSLRIRAGFDHQVRDGYLKNIGRVGDGKFGNKGMGNVNYWAARFSALADLSVHGALMHAKHKGFEVPEVGYEFTNAKGVVVAEVELAWPAQRLAVHVSEGVDFPGWNIMTSIDFIERN